MIKFIICDDNENFLIKEKKLINNLMMNYDTDYKIKDFSDYTQEFNEEMEDESSFKIYLLDIQTDTSSGLDIARRIREELDDWTSIIIMITAFNEFRYEALGTRLYLLDFISKLNECEDNLKETLRIAIKHYDNRRKSLKYEYNYIMKNIEYRHIVYIEKELDSKRCIIKTTYGEQFINKSLNDIFKMLDKRFVKTSRSCIANTDFIEEFNVSENKISFKNGDCTYLVSRSMKKELKEYVKSNH